MRNFDLSYGKSILGIDEVGLGPIAGPLVVCCVSIDYESFPNDLGINDSKLLSLKKREEIFKILLELQNKKIFWGIGFISNDELDNLGVTKSLEKGALVAIKNCNYLKKPECILIDGIKKFDLEIPSYPIKKGDQKSLAIASASIIAKVIRDQFMKNLSLVYKYYQWEKNVGYPTKFHIESIKKFGITKYHRKSYEPIKSIYLNHIAKT